MSTSTNQRELNPFSAVNVLYMRLGKVVAVDHIRAFLLAITNARDEVHLARKDLVRTRPLTYSIVSDKSDCQFVISVF